MSALQKWWRLVVWPPAEAHVDSVGYLVEVEGRVLGLQIHDETRDGGREVAAPGVLGAEEALHPLRIEARHPALQRAPGGRARLLRALGRGAAEEHQRAY